MLRTNVHGLQSFYSEMILKMEQNEPEKEDSWLKCDMKYLEFALGEEIREYNESGKKDELVDIANMCMMIYNRKCAQGVDMSHTKLKPGARVYKFKEPDPASLRY